MSEPNENPILATRAGREFQILCLDALHWLQWTCLGPDEIGARASEQLKRKAIWKNLKRWRGQIFDKILNRPPRPEGRPDTPAEFDDWLWTYLNRDWNTVFQQIGDSGSLMGYLSGYLSGALRLPQTRVDEMGIQEFDAGLNYMLGAGLNEPGDLKSRIGSGEPVAPEAAYARAYAEKAGSRWIAVYDENGERSGRAYEVISGLFRAQVAESIKAGEPVSQLRSRMVFPDLLALLEKGEITEDEYLAFSVDHLNRDFTRFAVTEASMAWANGRVAHHADVEKSTGRPQYLQFVRGGAGAQGRSGG